MLYARMADSGKAFEPQRNVMRHSFGLDGGGSVAADPSGNVYVSWHGIGEAEDFNGPLKGEARRNVWISRSANDGRTFETEKKAWPHATGPAGAAE